jgi:hypothetical protein
VTHSFIREVVNQLRHQRLVIDDPGRNIEHNTLGINWYEGFKHRHPDAATKWTRTLDTSRIEGVTFAKLSPYLAELAELLNKHHYLPAQIHKMDKTGFAIGVTQSTRVDVVERGSITKKKAIKSGAERGEWITSIECIAADGSSLPPLVILKGRVSVNSRWIPDSLAVRGWLSATSNKGWSNDYLTLKWLKNVFLPHTKSGIS